MNPNMPNPQPGKTGPNECCGDDKDGDVPKVTCIIN